VSFGSTVLLIVLLVVCGLLVVAHIAGRGRREGDGDQPGDDRHPTA
jgi:hypothetical protein